MKKNVFVILERTAGVSLFWLKLHHVINLEEIKARQQCIILKQILTMKTMISLLLPALTNQHRHSQSFSLTLVMLLFSGKS